MKRNSVAEYWHAVTHSVRPWTAGLRDVVVDQPSFDYSLGAAGDVPDWLRKSRRLAVASQPQDDFGAAIRVLQRNNRLLHSRFGVSWADAATVVLNEAQRRGVPASYVARVLASGLRHDEKGRGA